jgi:hypothetical protein
MADCAVREGAVTVHTGVAVVVVTGTGAGGEVPAGHTQSDRDPTKDTHCRMRLQEHGFSRWGEHSIQLKRKRRKLKRICG